MVCSQKRSIENVFAHAPKHHVNYTNHTSIAAQDKSSIPAVPVSLVSAVICLSLGIFPAEA